MLVNNLGNRVQLLIENNIGLNPILTTILNLIYKDYVFTGVNAFYSSKCKKYFEVNNKLARLIFTWFDSLKGLQKK